MDDDPGTAAIKDLTRAITQDSRVDACIIPIGDGLTLVRKR